ncbi:MAG: ATP synthase F1 subunit gamma [Nitrospirae bacterium]|nr:ATP synthase F1 subunit gamma [Nitrospirota bacterium]
MPTLRDIKRRITSVKSTQQITKAMKMVAASKLRRAQDRIFEARPYANKMFSVLSSLAMRTGREEHSLLAKRSSSKIEILVITTDRGLCGALNSNILKKAYDFNRQKKKDDYETSISTIGRKGRDFFRKRNIPMRKTWVGLSGKITYSNAQEIARDIVKNYTEELFDEVCLVYNEFKSAMHQRVIIEKLLPIEPQKVEKEEVIHYGEFIYEPSASEVLDTLLPKHIEVQIFRALLESEASEQGARMTAMDNATRNAKELIEKLTLQFNKARQAAITKELMEVVGGAEALK